MRKINLNKIGNLILKKALKKRYTEFMFWHGDTKHTDYNEKYNEETNYSESIYERDHVDYSDYNESFWHSDSTSVVHKDYIKGDCNDPNHSEYF
jgi:hypothetical protein